MITPTSQRCQLFSLQMDAVDFVRTAPPLPKALMDLVEKVIRVVMIPFAFIVDLAINTVRIVANIFISLANCLHGPPIAVPPQVPVVVKVVNEVASEILSPTPVEKNESPPAVETVSEPLCSSAPPPYVETPKINMDPQVDLLLTKLVELGVLNAISVGSELTKVGKTIRDVPPLEFLVMAVNTPERVKKMKEIFGNAFKRYNFMSYRNDSPCLNEKLTAAATELNFGERLSEFAKQTGVSLQYAQQCTQSQRWEDLVKQLIAIKSSPSPRTSRS